MLAEEADRLAARFFSPNNQPKPPNLPVNDHWQDILRSVDEYPITIIAGSTGCGKSTQVPQLLLEEMLNKRRQSCHIAVSQPRRLAAISIADSVCRDRKWTLGTICGYKVGLDSMTTSETRLEYVTTNVLVQRIIKYRSLNNYSHIIVDEVHERSQDLDCLLYLIRRLSKQTEDANNDAEDGTPRWRARTKIILMSATANTGDFVKYFGEDLCNFVSVEGRRYTVDKVYLDDLPTSLATAMVSARSETSKQGLPVTCIRQSQLAVVADLIFELDTEERRNPAGGRGAVLVFVPGLVDIRCLQRVLMSYVESRQLMLVPLHSTLSCEEQRRAFLTAPNGYRKVIIATNIAESSVTVRDIRYVVDFCLTKTLWRDEATGISSLIIEKCSQANCDQRAGRAGRVQNGRAYRLITRWEFEKLPKFPTPDILRSAIEVSVLKAKVLGLDAPKEVMANFISPPKEADVSNAILKLKEAQALRLDRNGQIDTDDGDLTIIGRVMAYLPLDIYLSKLIVMGFVFGCFEECIKMAACINGDIGIVAVSKDKLEFYKQQLAWGQSKFSDPIMMMNAFDKFITIMESSGDEDVDTLRKRVRQMGLHFTRCMDAYYLYEELLRRLNTLGFRVFRTPNRLPRKPGTQNLMIMMALAGAFYPNYFVQKPLDVDQTICNAGGKNPQNTVVISGLSPRYGPLYAQAIRSTLQECIVSDVQMTFQGIDAFLSFGSSADGDFSGSRTQAPIDVYLCVKHWIIHNELRLPKIPAEVGDRLLKELDLELSDDFESKDQTVILSISQDTVNQGTLAKQSLPPEKGFCAIVSQWNCDDVFKLFLRLEHRAEDLNHLICEINDQFGPDREPPEIEQKPTVGMLVLVRCDDKLHRARVVQVVPSQEQEHEQLLLQVFLIDEGTTVCVRETYKLPRSMLLSNDEAPFAYKAHLAHVRSPDGLVVRPKAHYLELKGRPCQVELLAVIDDVLQIDLFFVGTQDFDRVHLNAQLVHEGLAVWMDENLRQSAYENSASVFVRGQMSVCDQDQDSTKGAGEKLLLHGPRSPLAERLVLVSLRRRNLESNIVEVTEESINQVMLGSMGLDRGFLVAHRQFLSADKKRVRLASTTLVPSLSMILPFVALVFAPRAEYRCNSKQTAYIGAICGLGCRKTTPRVEGERPNQPMFESISPGDDTEVPFTHEMTVKDASLINHIRAILSEALGGNSEAMDWNRTSILKLNDAILDATMKFFNRASARTPRSRMNQSVRLHNPRTSYKWGLSGENSTKAHVMSPRQGLFLPHPIPRLRDAAYAEILSLLYAFMKEASQEPEPMISMCPLCLVVCGNRTEAYDHLRTEQHQSASLKLTGRV